MLSWKIRKYDELSIEEFYELVQLRIEVLVVDQDWPYQELDAKDQPAHHLLGYEEGQLKAYSRLFKGGIMTEDASIGRVIVRETARGKGYEDELLSESIKYIENEFKDDRILIHA